MRNVGALLIGLVLLAVATRGDAAGDRMTLDRCSLEYVDCATGPKSNCLIGPSQMDEDCMRRCETAREDCLERDSATKSTPAPRRRPGAPEDEP